jgi:hypothetical protein
MASRVHIPTARKNGEPYEEPHVVYIGNQRFTPPYRFRRSIWRNPYNGELRRGEISRDQAVALYRDHILGSEELASRLGELEGKALGCWCRLEEPCHGDVLIELLREQAIERIQADLGVDRIQAEFILALELGETDGDASLSGPPDST